MPDRCPTAFGSCDRTGAVVVGWLSLGTVVVWVVDPPCGQVVGYRADGPVSVLPIGDRPSGEERLPGFTFPLQELFAPD